jgi:hypothetical protein
MLPVHVDERCEFLSPRWIDAARAFLQAEVARRPALHGERFALSEAFAAAPPAVAGADGGAAWHFVLAEGRIEAGAGALPGADLVVEGDYQATLAMAQLVHAAGSAAQARALRELHHRHGTGAIRVRGRVPSALAPLLSDLHDHLAARTLQNPDYAHRVRRLGLERHVAELTEQGYTIIERAVSEAFADELRPRVADEVTRHHPLTTNGLLLRHRLFEEVAQHPLACTVAESAVGQGMILGAMSGTWKTAGPGAIDIHADYPLIREPYPEFGMIAVACWALEDWTEAAGPTWVMPGSHRLRRAPRRDDSRAGAVPILMPKGSIALWAHGVWHWQGDRSAADARVAIHVTYNRVFVRPLDDLSAVDDAMLARNPPAFASLMGRDDPFGKSSYRGHDNRRFAWAGRTVQT